MNNPEPTGTSPELENPWDRAHRELELSEARGLALERVSDQDWAPDLFQDLEQPPLLEGVTHSSLGLDLFWPPRDEQFRFGWHLEEDYSQLRAARERVGNPGIQRIRIGILDTGYDPGHGTLPAFLNRDLARNLTGRGDPFDAVDRTGAGFLQNRGHGTATLALLAGNQVDHPHLPGGRDWLGGAPFLEVVPIRIADSVVHFRGDAIAEGIEYATRIGCRVVSISMGGVPNKRWARAVNRAYEAGVVIVAAAGNRFGPTPPTTMVYPARFHRVIAVCGATFDRTPYYKPGLHTSMQGCFGPTGRMTSAIAAFTPNMPWAEFGRGVEVHVDGAGTSCATPQVAAAAALWLQMHAPALPAEEPWRCVEAVRHALFETADDRMDQFRGELGAGLLRANSALDVEFRSDLPQSPAADVRFKWFRLLFGLEAPEMPITPREELFETEALQLYLKSSEMQELAGFADPEEDSLEPDQVRAVLLQMKEDPAASEALKNRIAWMLGEE